MRKLLSLMGSFVLLFGQVQAQTRTLSGSVSDSRGNPLVNVSVVAKPSGGGTSTNSNGQFTLAVPVATKTLEISSVNFATQTVTIGNNTSFDVKLNPVEGSLETVVVVGYGTQTQRTRIQAASVVKGESFRNMAIVSPTQALQGQAAGVNMVNSSGLLGAASNVQVRGASSLIGGTQPLYVIDGVPLNDDVISGGQGGGTGLNPLLDLNPNDIESMTVLKDAAAVSIYGSRGTNGVILIKTKRGANQKTRVDVNAFKGYSRPTNNLEMLNADQYRTYISEYRAARMSTPATFLLATLIGQMQFCSREK